MRETSQESALIRLLRAGVLLGTMILIPGIAVCWNLLPKQQDLWASFAAEVTLQEPPAFDESAPPDTLVAETTPPFLAEPPIIQTLSLHSEPNVELSVPFQPLPGLNPTVAVDPFPMATAASETIKAMSWTDENEGKAVLIPTTFEEPAAIPANLESSTEIALSPQQRFPQLEAELQSLGAKYYRLQKWGSCGELFRFSCYVAAAEPYNYQKFFQAVENNEIRAMEQVIAEIKAWRE